jgi:hypothetical protein
MQGRKKGRFKISGSIPADISLLFCRVTQSSLKHPGAHKDPCATDERLLKSLLGRNKFIIMEIMGEIPFISIYFYFLPLKQ